MARPDEQAQIEAKQAEERRLQAEEVAKKAEKAKTLPKPENITQPVTPQDTPPRDLNRQ